MRQPGIFDRSRDHRSAITTLARDYSAGHVTPLPFHDGDQLVYASRGVMESGLDVDLTAIRVSKLQNEAHELINE
jgi:hypothetical protein